MWWGNKIWQHYPNDIIASDGHSADFLASYLRYSRTNREYVCYLEVMDLQKYKVISNPNKVRIVLRERMHLPFVFVVGRN